MTHYTINTGDSVESPRSTVGKSAQKPPGRPLDESEPKDRVITIRTTRTRKNAYVRAARLRGRNLTEWMIWNCDGALPEPLTAAAQTSSETLPSVAP